MAKKGKKKRNLKKQLKIELLGLLLIFLAIFGSGIAGISEGAISSILENVFAFLLGFWYFIASIILLIIGVILLVKRRFPNFKTNKMIGIYIGILGLLLLTHIISFHSILESSSDQSIIKLTWTHFSSYISGQLSVFQTGGGILGGVLFAISYYLFSSIGAYIVAIFLIIIGLIFITDLSLGDVFLKLWTKINALYKKVNNKWTERQTIKQRNISKDSIKQDNPSSSEMNNEILEIQDFTDIAYSFDEKEEVISPEETLDDEEAIENKDPIIQTSNSIEKENLDYQLPPADLLAEPTQNSQQHDKSHIQSTVKKLEETFHSFGVKAKVTKVHVGPAVTKYEVYPEAGVKVSRIVSLHDDLALALAAQDIRIEAPIPGKSAIGIEVPNTEVAMVSLKEVLDIKNKKASLLLFALGRDISGDAVVGELNKMPHLLIAGATGSGKSVCINGIIASILMRTKPHEVKMIMIDPKKVELNIYNGIPHLLTPVVTDPKKASQALKKVVAEMESRYELFSESATRNIEGYNDYVTQFNKTNEEQLSRLPFIVVLVDELADLMMVASKDVEDSITRLAQMARAAGIHLIIATQRPSVDVITGVIKANIPSRIAFSVSSQVDSRTILDMGGAEKLLGRGDMLYIPVGQSKAVRVQGAFLSDDEVERIVKHCIDQQEVTYQENMIPEEVSTHAEEVDDEIYDDAVKLVTEMQTASVSMLQRRFRIGYTRAGRLIDAMEDRSIVGPNEGSKPRTVLVTESVEEETK